MKVIVNQVETWAHTVTVFPPNREHGYERDGYVLRVKSKSTNGSEEDVHLTTAQAQQIAACLTMDTEDQG